MNEKLLEYINRKLDYGHDIEEIKKALVNAGHELVVVEQHISHVINLKNIEKKISEFVKKNVEKGIHVDRIKEFLTSAGYDIELVEKHIGEALRARKTRRLISMFLIAIIIVSLFIGGFYFVTDLKKIEFEKPLGKNLDRAVAQSESENYLATNSSCDSACANKKILNQALIESDLSICSKITETNMKAQCEQFLKKR